MLSVSMCVHWFPRELGENGRVLTGFNELREVGEVLLQLESSDRDELPGKEDASTLGANAGANDNHIY